MKNLFYVLVLTVFTTSAFSQSIIERNYSQYVDQEDVTHVYVSGKMFDFASTIVGGLDDEEANEIAEFASKIQSFSLIKVPNPANAKAEYQKGMNDIGDDYDELMRVRDDGTKFAIYVDEDNDIVYEIVGLGIVDGEFIALSLVGEMDLNKIAKFINEADTDAFKPLKRMGDFNPSELKVYPNPTNSNSELNFEVPAEMIGGKATLINMEGAKIRTFNISSSKESINTGNLTPGNYFLEFNNSGVTMKKQVIIAQ